jgi:hypothetical protein
MARLREGCEFGSFVKMLSRRPFSEELERKLWHDHESRVEILYPMSRFVCLSAAVVILVCGVGSLQARIQDGSADVCWEPDHEWPVPCDDEE